MRDYFDRDRRDRDRERDKDRRRDDRDRRDRDHDRDKRDRRGGDDRDKEREREREREKERQRAKEEREKQERERKLQEKLEKRRTETEGYDECYPGGLAELGGGWDSDEEDLSKMDLGNKKVGPIKRWDFEHEEDYESYQGQREAMPKAAYQFGVKTGDGRKTRKSTQGNTEKSVEKKLDRELNEINKLMEKRKTAGEGPDAKKVKY